jgi:hypothetical protein
MNRSAKPLPELQPGDILLYGGDQITFAAGYGLAPSAGIPPKPRAAAPCANLENPLNIAGVMITCPGREPELAATLKDLRHGGDTLNRQLPLHVQKDESKFDRPQTRQEHNALSGLIVGLNRYPEAEVLLFFEDDLIFNSHLVWNLQWWAPLRIKPKRGERRMFFGSLYDPTIRELEAHPNENYFIADPEAVYGSQAFVMSRAMAEYFVAHWWSVEGMQDIKMSRLAAHHGDIYYHMPSLVQHVGIKSTWTDDARFHDTKSFSREWRAKT